MPVDGTKLIYKGKLLKNDDPLSATNYKEGEFIVAMAPRKKFKKKIAPAKGKMEEE